jgi:hypothetical protein
MCVHSKYTYDRGFLYPCTDSPLQVTPPAPHAAWTPADAATYCGFPTKAFLLRFGVSMRGGDVSDASGSLTVEEWASKRASLMVTLGPGGGVITAHLEKCLR